MKRVSAAYVALGLTLWFVPLLNVLQAESAAVVAFVSFFVAGWSATDHFRAGRRSFWGELGRQEGAVLIPLGMLLISPLWAPNCTLGQGLLFYALFPGITVVLAVAVAYALTSVTLSRPRLILGGIGLVISVVGPVYDLGAHPQFYTYNHVFGGVLGPIYDEQLAVRTGLFAFRGLTLLWAAVVALLGAYFRGRTSQWAIWTGLVAIGAVYWFSVPLGINTSANQLQHRLGGHHRTPHFDLYYDPDRLDEREVAALAADHEAAYDYLSDLLSLSSGNEPARIQSYLYPNRDTKAQLTGARATSVTPVWLDDPQIHLLVERVDASLGHELAHVFSRPYGLPLLRASWAPGLVEGWAVALEPPGPHPPAHDLVSVATVTDSVEALSAKADAIASRLSPWGFWSGRGAVSYATMGSFVRYLMDTYGPEAVKRVYARGNFEAVYGRSLASLASAWADTLRARSFVARGAHDVVGRRFTQPSLFEAACPHYVPPHRRHLQAARRAARDGDSSMVDQQLREALTAAPRYEVAHAALARRRLARGEVEAVRRQLDTLSTEDQSATLHRLLGDAHARLGNPTAARKNYRQGRIQLPRYAHDTRMRLLLRDAVADVPKVVRALTDDTTPQRQAEALAGVESTNVTAVHAWRALRLQDANRFARADSVWQSVSSPPEADWPRAWKQEWALQRRAWQAEAAHRAGRKTDRFSVLSRARRLYRSAARRAEAHGAREWASALDLKAERARADDSDATVRSSARTTNDPGNDRFISTVDCF